MLSSVLPLLLEKKSLSESQSFQAMADMMSGQEQPAQIASFLLSLRAKGETVEEIVGFARAMRAKGLPFDVEGAAAAVDVCGTGGDGLHMFNVSTVAAFVVAGAGVGVLKHGNRSVSSLCGSADVLQALGVDIEKSIEQWKLCYARTGMAFLWAPLFHPAMKHVASVRKELGVRTVFNLLGPLTNPARVQRQLLGVYDRQWLKPLAEVLRSMGSRHVMVVCGEDGSDEISLVGRTHVCELTPQGQIKTYDVHPGDVGLDCAKAKDLKGGDAGHNAGIARVILDQEQGSRRDMVVLNAGAAIYVGGGAATWKEGVALAQQSIDTGRAKKILQLLCEEK